MGWNSRGFLDIFLCVYVVFLYVFFSMEVLGKLDFLYVGFKVFKMCFIDRKGEREGYYIVYYDLILKVR